MPSKNNHREGERRLHQAISLGNVADLEELLAAGVDPNAFADERKHDTALTKAIQSVAKPRETFATRARLAEVLDASFRLDPSRSHLADEIAQLCPPPGPEEREAMEAEVRRRMAITRLLLAAGADPNQRPMCRTPLSLAACYGNTEIVELLLAAGANPDGASFSPFSKLVKPDEEMAFCSNAIHEAAKKGFLEIVRLLCSRGADASVRDHEGKTALQLAKERGYVEIVQMLEDYES